MSAGGSAERRNPEVDKYRPEVWSSSTSTSAAAAAVCCPPAGGCALSASTNATDQFRPTVDHRAAAAAATNSSYWFAHHAAFTNGNALFRGSGGGSSDSQFYDQSQQHQDTTPTAYAATVQPPSAAVLSEPISGACCDFTPDNCGRFHAAYNYGECFDFAAPFNREPTYQWLQSKGESYVGGTAPFPNQCVGLSVYPPDGSYGPAASEVVPYSPSAWLHVKWESRSSSSATSSSFDGGGGGGGGGGGPPAGTCVAPKKLVPTSPPPTYLCDDSQLKRELYVSQSADCVYDDFALSADADEWTSTGCCRSDASRSSAEQFSEVVCRSVCAIIHN